jgi:hypothetical protein
MNYDQQVRYISEYISRMLATGQVNSSTARCWMNRLLTELNRQQNPLSVEAAKVAVYRQDILAGADHV